MRIIFRGLIAAAALASEPAGALPPIDFDQGADTSALLQEARETASRQLDMLFAPEIETPSALDVKSPTIAGVHPPITPLIIQSAPYRDAIALRGDSRYGSIPGDQLQPLEKSWGQILTIRTALLSQANRWEDDNDALYEDGLALDKDRERIETRRRELIEDIDLFNRECAGRPLPPGEYEDCLRRQNELIRRRDSLAKEIADYNARVELWRSRSASIAEQRATIVSTIGIWENRIRTWIQAVKGALGESGGCRQLHHLEINPQHSTVFTGGQRLPIEVKTIFTIPPPNAPPAPPCEVDLFWDLTTKPDVPNTVVGFISTRKGRQTTFTSGGGTGFATATVQDLNSGTGEVSQITVRRAPEGLDAK